MRLPPGNDLILGRMPGRDRSLGFSREARDKHLYICGGLVGVTEIASRYRDEQLKAILSPDGLVYVLFNGAISSFALILIFQFRGTPPFSSFKSTLLAAIAAGFGATAIMRTRLAVIKGSDNKEISIGPDIVINLLLSMIDRRIDRWRAARRQLIVADHLGTLKALGTVEQTTQYLFAALLAFQNLSEAEKQQFIDTIKANKEKISDVNIQFQAVGFLFLTIVGEENFESALEKAKKIKDEAADSAPPPGQTVPPPTGTTVPRPTTGGESTQSGG
jgi:hypothetical protein